MSIDRMADISSWRLGQHGGEESARDIEAGVSPNRNMEQFFQYVDSIKADIDAIEKAKREILSIQQEMLRATTTAAENGLHRRVGPLVNQTNKRAKRTKDILTLLKEENNKLNESEYLPQSDLRVRENLCNSLMLRFVDEVRGYQDAQQKFKTDIKQKITRQIQIVKPEATEEEVNTIMRSEGGRDAVYKQTVLSGSVNEQIKTTYATVAGKYQDILMIEQSVAELHQMFLDLSLLVETQGSTLDQIELHVTSAADHVEKGNVNIHKSIELQQKVRNKKCWIILVVAVCVLVILLPILF